MNKIEYVKALRELADYVEAREFPDQWKGYWGSDDSFEPPYLSIRVNEKKDFGTFCSAMGSYEKERTDYSTGALAKLPGGAIVRVYSSRDVVCKKIVVGKRVIPATQERIIEAEPEREEDIVEWECPESFNALKEEQNAEV